MANDDQRKQDAQQLLQSLKGNDSNGASLSTADFLGENKLNIAATLNWRKNDGGLTVSELRELLPEGPTREADLQNVVQTLKAMSIRIAPEPGSQAERATRKTQGVDLAHMASYRDITQERYDAFKSMVKEGNIELISQHDLQQIHPHYFALLHDAGIKNLQLSGEQSLTEEQKQAFRLGKDSPKINSYSPDQIVGYAGGSPIMHGRPADVEYNAPYKRLRGGDLSTTERRYVPEGQAPQQGYQQPQQQHYGFQNPQQTYQQPGNEQERINEARRTLTALQGRDGNARDLSVADLQSAPAYSVASKLDLNRDGMIDQTEVGKIWNLDPNSKAAQDTMEVVRKGVGSKNQQQPGYQQPSYAQTQPQMGGYQDCPNGQCTPFDPGNGFPNGGGNFGGRGGRR